MTNVAVILGHPDTQSLSSAIARAYAKGAQDSGAVVREIDLAQLKFDPVLWHGYNEIQPLEPDLAEAQQTIQWADVLVFAYPTWWGAPARAAQGIRRPGVPARIRVLLPGELQVLGPSAHRAQRSAAGDDGHPRLVLPLGGAPAGAPDDASLHPRIQRGQTGPRLPVRRRPRVLGRHPPALA